MSTVKTNNVQIGQSVTPSQNMTWYQPSTPDGTVRLGVGNSGATTADVITVNNSGIASTTITTANGNTVEATSGPTQTQLSGNRNKIINGAMMIDQRNVGSGVAVSASYNKYSVDRFAVSVDVGAASATAQQSSVVPNSGYTNSLSLTVGTSGTASAAQQCWIEHRIEGYNIADLNFGSSSAATITLSFWVRSSVTGTYSIAFRNNPAARSYVATYVINSANTFEQKTVTIAGDTSGTWATNSSIGLQILFDLGTGSNFYGTAGSWQSGNLYRTSGSVSWISNAGATFYITGVQLEKGATATPFENRLYGTELALCQRYYQTAGSGCAISLRVSSQFDMTIKFPVAMRASPTGTHIANYAVTCAGNTQTITSTNGPNAFTTNGATFGIVPNNFIGVVAGTMAFVNSNIDGLALSAEL